MKTQTNQFRQKLKSGKPQFGLWLGIADQTVAQICAGAGFDWLLIDAEHGPFEPKDIMTHLMAIEPYRVPAIVRALEANTALVKKLLDIGAQSLLIPMIETAAQAQQMVQAANYPPKGVRGLGTSMARAAQWNRIADYAQTANDEICLILQIETRTAIDNLAEIAAVEGVDALFIGSSDLSASLGYVGQPDHPQAVEIIDQAISVIKQAGKAVGILSVTEPMINHYIDQGVDFIGIGVDTALLGNAAQALAANFIKGKSKKPTAGY